MKKFLDIPFLLAFFFIGMMFMSCSEEYDNEFFEELNADNPEHFNLYRTWVMATNASKYIEYNMITLSQDGTYHYEYRKENTNGDSSLDSYKTEDGVIESVTDTKLKTVSNSGTSKTWTIKGNALYRSGYYVPAVGMTTLESGITPTTKAPAVYLYVDEQASSYKITAIRYLGVDKFDLITDEKEYKDITSGKSVTVYKKEGKNEFTVSARAFGKDGKPYPAKIVKCKYDYHDPNLDLPLNYYKCNGKVYELNEAVFKVEHGLPSSNGTGTNWEILNLNATPSATAINTVQIRYSVHDWEPVSVRWVEGTYPITNSGHYYSYSCMVLNNGNAIRASEGTLTLKKKSSSYWIIDLKTDEVTAHFEGNGSY